MIKQIKHLEGFTIFYANENGNIFRKHKGKMKKLKHHITKNNTVFVRLCQDAKSLSMTVGKAVLLAFRPHRYKPDKIAVHNDGNKLNVKLKNLIWSDRKKQSQIAMRNPVNYNRVRDMGRKYGEENGRINGASGAKNLIEWLRKNRKEGDKIYSPDFKNAVVALVESGQTKGNVAKVLKMPRSSVNSIMRRKKKSVII